VETVGHNVIPEGGDLRVESGDDLSTGVKARHSRQRAFSMITAMNAIA
jgi:hypothetical protein